MSDPALSRIRYPQAVTSALAASEARSFLASEGLPAEHELFDLLQPHDVAVEEHACGRSFLFVAVSPDIERYGIDIASGAVVAVNIDDSSLWHINANVMTFARSMDEFTERLPFGSSGREEYQRVADEFRDRLLAIDPTSLSEDPGYWYTLLHDISIGDYSAKEFE